MLYVHTKQCLFTAQRQQTIDATVVTVIIPDPNQLLMYSFQGFDRLQHQSQSNCDAVM